jgi:Ca2+-binding EF-hand superfamily protein
MEVLALYDKQSNGTMQIDELRHILCAVGEQLTDADVTMVWNECGTEEDEDGYVKYEPFVRKLLAGPFPDEPAA